MVPDAVADFRRIDGQVLDARYAAGEGLRPGERAHGDEAAVAADRLSENDQRLGGARKLEQALEGHRMIGVPDQAVQLADFDHQRVGPDTRQMLERQVVQVGEDELVFETFRGLKRGRLAHRGSSKTTTELYAPSRDRYTIVSTLWRAFPILRICGSVVTLDLYRGYGPGGSFCPYA